MGVVAEMTEGFSFAYLKELFVMALLGLVRGAKTDEEDEDVDDAKDVDDKKKEEEDAEEEKGEKEEEVCNCAAKCATCHKPLPPTASSSETQKKTDEADEAEEEATSNKMVLTNVEIPEHLKDNLLLKVIKQQIRILHSEMDNTQEESWPGGKASIKGGAAKAARMAARRRAMRRRAQMC